MPARSLARYWTLGLWIVSAGLMVLGCADHSPPQGSFEGRADSARVAATLSEASKPAPAQVEIPNPAVQQPDAPKPAPIVVEVHKPATTQTQVPNPPVIIATPAATQPAPTTKPATTQANLPKPSFIGEWQTTYGKMNLKKDGEFIVGNYGTGPAAGTIKGKVEGLKFTFTYAEKIVTGEGWYEMSADGASFAGKWRPQGETAWGDWTGTRLSSPDSFSGLWRTEFGKMRLSQIGTHVTGVYEYGGGSNISGEMDGRTLKFKYDQPDGEKGEGAYTLSADGVTFTGAWKSNHDTGGEWNGFRVAPKEGKTWLIVLEARWENNLEEQEYSYGDMLRAFFVRIPSVQMRHRFITDEASFRKYCAEANYIAEPVVLYISSHGTKEGIGANGKLIPANVIIDCVKNLGDVRLLHFGSCMVAGGDIPKQLREATGKRFPVSGFVNAADWGGSAVIDFTYLDLVLERNMSPAMAVAQTRKMLSFARENSAPDDVISGAGLVVVDGK